MVIWLGDGKHGIVLPTLLNIAEHNLSTAQPARPVGLPQGASVQELGAKVSRRKSMLFLQVKSMNQWHFGG